MATLKITDEQFKQYAKKIGISDSDITAGIKELRNLVMQPTQGGGVPSTDKIGIKASVAIKGGKIVVPGMPNYIGAKPAETIKSGNTINTLASAMGLNAAKEFIPNITATLKGLKANDILDVFKGMIEELNENIKDLIENKGFEPEETKSIAEGIKKGITKEFEKFFKSEEGKNAVKGIIKPEEEIRTSFVKKSWDAIKHHIVHGFFGTLDEIKEEIKSDFEELRDEIKDEWNEVLGPKLHALYDGILKTLKTAFSWLDPVKKWFKDKFMKGLNSLLGLTANTITAGKGGGVGMADVAAGSVTGNIITKYGGKILGGAGALLGGAAGAALAGAGLMYGMEAVDRKRREKDPEYAEHVNKWGSIEASLSSLYDVTVEEKKDIAKLPKEEYKNLDRVFGITSPIYQLWETLLKPFTAFADSMGDIARGLNKFFGFKTESAPMKLNETVQATLEASIKAAQVGSIAAQNCGDLVAKVINPSLKAVGGKTLLEEGGLGINAAQRMSSAYGSKLIKHNETPFTAETMRAWQPGTIMVGGHGNDSHAQVVAINPQTGEKGILSQGPGPPRFKTFEEAERDINAKGWNNWTATNPFEGIGPDINKSGGGLLDKFINYINPQPGTINVGAKGSISDRQNNPFNLKIPGSKTGAKGYTIFDTLEEGYAAGIKQLKLEQSRGLTANQFVDKYYGKTVPGVEKYRMDFLEKAGMAGDMSIANLPLDKFARVIAGMESSTTIKPSLEISAAEREKSQAAASISNRQFNAQEKANEMLKDMINQKNITNQQGGDTNIIAPQTNAGQQHSQEDTFGFNNDFFAQVIGLSLSVLTV